MNASKGKKKIKLELKSMSSLSFLTFHQVSVCSSSLSNSENAPHTHLSAEYAYQLAHLCIMWQMFSWPIVLTLCLNLTYFAHLRQHSPAICSVNTKQAMKNSHKYSDGKEKAHDWIIHCNSKGSFGWWWNSGFESMNIVCDMVRVTINCVGLC